MDTKSNRTHGFTLIELLIAIIVIGILASLTVVGYNGVQKTSREKKIETDLTQLKDAIIIARQRSHKTLPQLTGSFQSAAPCVLKPAGTDLAALPRTDPCWANYLNVLNVVSKNSGVDLTGLVDPWGRPYFIDENESEINAGDPPGYPGHCWWDTITAFNYPTSGGWVNSDYKTNTIKPNDLVPSGYTQCNASANGP